MTAYDDRRLWPGTVPPVDGSPARVPGSVRRTTNVDLLRPDGLAGDLVLAGRGRDLRTGAAGAATVVAEAATEVVVDYVGTRLVTAVTADPPPPGLEALVGARAGSGFRRTLGEVLPELAAGGSLVHLLLDEVTPATLISGSVLARQGLVQLAADGPASRAPIDICAGWQAGGAMLDTIAETGVPLLGWGPPAPVLEADDDPGGWHAMVDLPPSSMRRRRLIDLRPGVGPGGDLVVDVEVRYRDSYWEDDGTETVVHEYGLAASVDPRSWTFLAAAATPGPLPAPECPTAAASAGRLAGRTVAGLRDQVRQEFVGTSTCTHLNDVFRSLADVAHLWSRSD